MYVFRAPSEDDLADWLTALRKYSVRGLRLVPAQLAQPAARVFAELPFIGLSTETSSQHARRVLFTAQAYNSIAT